MTVGDGRLALGARPAALSAATRPAAVDGRDGTRAAAAAAAVGEPRALRTAFDRTSTEAGGESTGDAADDGTGACARACASRARARLAPARFARASSAARAARRVRSLCSLCRCAAAAIASDRRAADAETRRGGGDGFDEGGGFDGGKPWGSIGSVGSVGSSSAPFTASASAASARPRRAARNARRSSSGRLPVAAASTPAATAPDVGRRR